MGLLALDITAQGVVMSADSQPIEILDGETCVLDTADAYTRNPILVFSAAGGDFQGLLGYVGTEQIGERTTGDWLRSLADSHQGDSLADFCHALAAGLTEEWTRLSLRSVLEIFVSGVENRDPRFWFVRNSHGLHGGDWTYMQGSTTFVAVDDLDGNYVTRDLPAMPAGTTKEELLSTRIYSFRQGILQPTAAILDGFSKMMQEIYAQRSPGFEPIQSLDDLGKYARQRIEFTKRIFSPDHGIFSGSRGPIDGVGHVLGIGLDRSVREYPLKSDVKIVRPGRTD